MMFGQGVKIGARRRVRMAAAVALCGILPQIVALGGSPGYGFYGEGEGGTGGGGTGGGTGGAGGGTGGTGDPPPAPMVPKTEADRAFAARDAAKKNYRALLGLVGPALGIDPAATIKLSETGDSDNPYRIEVDGDDRTEDIRTALGGGAGGGAPKRGTGKKLDEVETNLKRANKQLEARTKNLDAITKRVEAVEATAPLRAAFAAAGALDSGGEAGTYADLIALARPFVRVTIATDEETGLVVTEPDGSAKVGVYFVDAKGEKVTDAQGSPLTLTKWVEKFLDARPAFKQRGTPRGPGAGGYGTANGGKPAQGDPVSHGRTAAAGMFGMGGGNGNGTR